MSDEFRAKLEALPDGPPRYKQSAARVRMREAFDAVTNAKNRGVTWQAIAELMNADGLRAQDGGDLTASHVAALYASEKKNRGIRPKRRTKKAKSQQDNSQAVTATAGKATFDPNDGEPADKPKPKFSVARPR